MGLSSVVLWSGVWALSSSWFGCGGGGGLSESVSIEGVVLGASRSELESSESCGTVGGSTGCWVGAL